MQYYYNDPGGMNYQYSYQAQLAEARKLEKKAMFVNCSKLGAILLMYNFFTNIFVYVYYLVACAAGGGGFTLSVREAVTFLQGEEELVNSTAFSMGGNLFLVVCSLTAVLLIARFAMKVDLSEMTKPEKKHAEQAAKWFPMCLVLNSAASIIIAIFVLTMSEMGITVPESDFTIQHPSTAAIVLQFTYVVVIGPIAEELLYRGVILTLLKPFGKFMAVFFSALIFGIMHGNIPQAASAFAMALVFGTVAVQCNSIGPTILIHIANNAVASYTDFAEVFNWAYADEILMGFEILMMFMGVYMLFVNGWRLKIRNDNRYAMTSSQRYAAVYTNIFMIIYFLYAFYKIAEQFILENA